MLWIAAGYLLLGILSLELLDLVNAQCHLERAHTLAEEIWFALFNSGCHGIFLPGYIYPRTTLHAQGRCSTMCSAQRHLPRRSPNGLSGVPRERTRQAAALLCGKVFLDRTHHRAATLRVQSRSGIDKSWQSMSVATQIKYSEPDPFASV